MKVQTLVTIEKGKLKGLKARPQTAEARAAKSQKQAEDLAKALKMAKDALAFYARMHGFTPVTSESIDAAIAAYQEGR